MKNPEILTCSILPISIHGKSPKKIMGYSKWEKVKKEKQKLADHHCMCCDEYIPHVPGNYLECHEMYKIDIEKRIFELEDIVCICRKCHDFIHHRRLSMLLYQNQITQEYYDEVMERGRRILEESNLVKNDLPEEEIDNPNWKLLYNGNLY